MDILLLLNETVFEPELAIVMSGCNRPPRMPVTDVLDPHKSSNMSRLLFPVFTFGFPYTLSSYDAT